MDELLAENPEIALQLTRELSRRLSDVVTQVEKRPGHSIVTVFGDQAWQLAEYDKAEDFIRLGEEATQREMSLLQTLLNN
jgi:CRP-like cAMP-binding protein